LYRPTTVLPHRTATLNLQVIKLLIDAGANIEATLQPAVHPDRPASLAATPLAVASMFGKLEAMQVLLGGWQQGSSWKPLGNF
jgi:hypothetical protein